MIRALIFPLVALGLASPAIGSRTYDKLPSVLDPTKAYVVVEIGKLDNAMLDGTLVLARYDADKGDIAATTLPPEGKTPRGGWPLDNRIFLTKPAIRTKGHRLFVAELDPGLWVVEGANDTSFSLGSSTLQLAAGTVADMGVASVYSDFPEGEKRDVLTTGRMFKGALMGGIFGRTLPQPMPKAVDFRVRATGDMPLPALLVGAAPVQWAGEVRFGNNRGTMVNRMGGRKARFRALAAEQAAAEASEPATSSEAEPAAPPVN